MKVYFLVHDNFEQLAQQEIFELIKQKSIIHKNVVECNINSKEEFITLLQHFQSARRILLGFTSFKDINSLNLAEFNIQWQELFTNDLTFKVEVENLPGQDNRFALAKQLANKFYQQFESNLLTPKIELKKPDYLILTFYNGEEYFLGLDFSPKELNSRAYRLFPHQASFKGDLAYYFVKYAKIQPNTKILIGFSKDGTIAIESALFLNKLSLTNLKKTKIFQIPFFKDLSITATPTLNISLPSTPIEAFDEVSPNIIASLKNSSLAHTNKLINFHKYALDELDVKYEQYSFDTIIFHLTTKDEEKINDLYYQSDYILKQHGKMLLLTKKTFELSLSSKFSLLQSTELHHGDSSYKLWLLQKK